MVWVLIYKTLLDKGFKVDWLSNDHYNFGALLFYNLWLGFAGNMVLYTGAMGRVPPELVEAGHLDGMNDFQEFVYIVIPLIFPTLSVILTTCIVTIFSIQLPVFVFYNLNLATNKHHLYTFGLYTFLRGYGQDPRHTPLVSTISILVCLVAAPASVLFRRVLEKISPTVEY
jgi:ABC-type sugar transport system permease subunit